MYLIRFLLPPPDNHLCHHHPHHHNHLLLLLLLFLLLLLLKYYLSFKRFGPGFSQIQSYPYPPAVVHGTWSTTCINLSLARDSISFHYNIQHHSSLSVSVYDLVDGEIARTITINTENYCSYRIRLVGSHSPDHARAIDNNNNNTNTRKKAPNTNFSKIWRKKLQQ